MSDLGIERAGRTGYAVVVKGAGDKAFCAGGDVRALHRGLTASSGLHPDFFAAEYRLDYFVHRYPKPHIALMDGIVMGGGMGIAQGTFLRVVTERTRMAMPEAGIGLFPDVGASYFLSRLRGALGTYLGVSGTEIGAADALYCGLADAYIPHAALARLEAVLAELRWSEHHFTDIRNAIRGLASIELPAPPLAALRPAIDTHFACFDVRSIIESLKAESRPRFGDWARQTLATMATRSPLMMTVTGRQLELGQTFDLADCFRMELGMAAHCLQHGDFMEGVRAVLIDKDKAPRWNPTRVEDVTGAMVAAFFVDPWPDAAHPFANLEAEGRLGYPAASQEIDPAPIAQWRPS